MTRLVLITFIALFATAAPVQGYDYFPLDPNDPNSEHWYVNVEDPQVVCCRYTNGESQGYFVHVHHLWVGETESEYYFNRHLKVDEQGSVWLRWEFNFSSYGYSAVFDPDCRLIDAPLYVGKTWSWESDHNEDEFIEFTCLAEEDIELCGNVYHSFHVYGEGQKIAMVGWYFGIIYWEYSAWHCDGFGVVKYTAEYADVLYELDCQVSTEATTWSEVKALYR